MNFSIIDVTSFRLLVLSKNPHQFIKNQEIHRIVSFSFKNAKNFLS